MKTLLKILWKLAQAALVVVPFVLLYSDASYAQETGFAVVYMAVAIVMLAVLVGVAYYEDQWEGDPGAFCRALRVIAIVAITLLVFLREIDKQRAFDGFYTYAIVVMCMAVALYFFYLELSFFPAEAYFTILALISIVMFFVAPELESDMQNIVGGAALGFAVISVPVAKVVCKICDLISGVSSSGGKVKRKEKKFWLSAVENACRACAHSNYTVTASKSGSAIKVTIRGVGGYRASGIEAARVRTTLEDRLHVNLSNTNIYITW